MRLARWLGRGRAAPDGSDPRGLRWWGSDVAAPQPETIMAMLNDTQMLLLATAAKRESGSLYPLPETRNGAAARAAKAVTALMKLGLVIERETKSSPAIVRRDGYTSYGIFVTPAGLTAIGVVEDETNDGASGIIEPFPAPTSKREAVLTLLRAGEGATMAELIAATGWLPHTTRAALTGLRKQGHVIERGKRDDATCYRIVGAA